jgi:hypothetical protein
MNSAAALWGVQVAARTILPDVRLNKRLASLLGAFATAPEASIPRATGGWAAAKGAYRFLENPRVIDADLLKGVTRYTAEQAVRLPALLIVQDTSSFNFTRLRSIAELGPIDSAGLARGLFFHSSLALDSKGKALGLLDVQFWARPKAGQFKPEEKESRKWICGMDNSRLALGEVAPGGLLPHLIHIMDREGDCFDVMLAIDDAGDSAIIRCVQNRRVKDPLGLAHDQVRRQPLLGVAWIDVPRSPGKATRRAEVEVRTLQATLVPDREKYPHGWEMTWNLIELWEPYPPIGEEALRWLLWTREPAATLEEALAVAAKYTRRWVIEDFHLTCKSGCRIEELQLESWEGLLKALVLYTAVAARVAELRDWARHEPEASAQQLLSAEECLVLRSHFDPTGKVKGELTLAQAILWIGRLGGHLNRKSDGMPGVRTLWKGLRDLALLVEGFRAARHSLDHGLEPAAKTAVAAASSSNNKPRIVGPPSACPGEECSDP